MTITIPVERAQVLLTVPGPRASETIHALLAQGATVTVETDRPTPELSDLASRGLVRLQVTPDYAEYDIVVRDWRTTANGGVPHVLEPGFGQVTLVGGGPGDVGLLTIAGLEAIRAADVVVCDRLAPLSVLDKVRPGAEVIHVGKIPRGAFTPQETIDALLVDRALKGANVVRLKGGDGFVFGRGGEEWNACVNAGIPIHVIPGVSSAVAVPALAGIPITHRSLTQGFVVVSGHVSPSDPRSEVDWQALAQLKFTIVVLMGVASLHEIAETLIASGMDPQTPSACIADGGMPSMRLIRASLASISEASQDADISAPAVTVIGDVVDALRHAT